MKKIITLLLFTAIYQSLTAQIIFYEDFDGFDGPTFGGAGTYSFPAGWRLRNVDNLTPDAQVAYINEAWERREDFGLNVLDSCAFSTSYYSPAGTANDFMWTPLIGPITAQAVLSWRARSYDNSYRDSYEVRIMTVTPTGGNGDIGNQLTQSTQVFSIAEENTTWTTRSVSLSAFAGQMVYIGFRNTSNDKFILVVDDIKVEIVIPHDAQVLAANDFEYAQIPLSQAGTIPLWGSLRNNGVNALTNVRLTARIYNSSNVLVQEETSASLPSFTPGLTTGFTLPSWTPATADTFTIKYFPVSDQADVVPANDTLTRSVIITNLVYARDNGILARELGIGTGNGYMGQSFVITVPVELRSVTAAFTRGYVGRKYGLVVWNTTPAGVPNAIVAATDTLLYPDDNPLLDTVPIYGGLVALSPGTYVVTAIEFDSTLALIQTSAIFTPGTTWTSWNTQPWANLEAFGTQFTRSFYIRINVAVAGTLPVKVVSFTGSNTQAGNKLQWVVSEQQGIQTYEVEKSVNGVDFKKIGVVQANDRPSFTYTYTDADVFEGTAYYRLKIIEDAKTTYTKIISIKLAAVNTLSIAPNPVQRVLTLKSRNMQLLNTNASILDINGKKMKQFVIKQLPFTIDMGDLPAGVYLLRLFDNSVIKMVKQ